MAEKRARKRRSAMKAEAERDLVGAERTRQWLRGHFPCGHVRTSENTTRRDGSSGKTCRSCKAIKARRTYRADPVAGAMYQQMHQLKRGAK